MKNLDIARAFAYFAWETSVLGDVRGTFGIAVRDVAAADAGCTSTACTAAPGFTFCTPATMTRSPSLRPPWTI
jgi:hypothetical protein